MDTVSAFPDGAFTVASGRAAGIGRGVLAGSRFEHPFHGVRAARGPEGATDRERMLDLCRRYAPRLKPGEFFSHETMLVAAGAPTPRAYRAGLHISVYRPAMHPRTVGVIGHRLQARERAAWRIGSLPIEHPARAWVQTSALWHPDDLIAAADFLVARKNPLVTIEQLRDEARLMRRPGLVRVLDEVRPGSESKRETELRLAVVRAGIPEPQLNWELHDHDGGLVARLDLAWPRYGVAAEYDGRQHAFDVTQFQRDADRWDAIRARGWQLERILDHHKRTGGAAAIAKVSGALRGRGWRS